MENHKWSICHLQGPSEGIFKIILMSMDLSMHFCYYDGWYVKTYTSNDIYVIYNLPKSVIYTIQIFHTLIE